MRPRTVIAAAAAGVLAAAPAAVASPPAVAGVAFAQAEPAHACGPGAGVLDRGQGPGVAFAVRTEVRAQDGPARVQATADRSEPGRWVAAGDPVVLRAAPGGPVWVRAKDEAGATSRWKRFPTPAATLTLVRPERMPFTAGLLCPAPPPRARVGAINRAWRSAGGRARDRQIVRPRGSALVWTSYAGQGIHPNWVHVGTELNQRLQFGRVPSYRAAVSETLSWSTLDRAPGGALFRLNENTFRAPDDGRPPPWRDGMGTAVLLALLVPAIPYRTDDLERALARRAASQYLATFSVSWRAGGVVWRDHGPGEWYLEYAYRPRERVLNGFMQSLVSLARFARQAERLGARDRGWLPLAARARERVTAGARALNRWLPRYHLGPRRTRYSLRSGPANAKYRVYHVRLLGELQRVPYIEVAWRTRFAKYRRAWR